ncbi:ADP-ribosylglycohydrolase-domain-containing protein [Bombardia bombarda]|uniref:ADP-ribosylglycohydrolase-domain-containing protein n=1 Tax=Bombardia bombarda TaxID=252184 RepID=A0AA39TH17_9PEZI|nr:ADP-ribosylglycohydrolase-domain-containing protein [Bombardia bombarda]
MPSTTTIDLPPTSHTASLRATLHDRIVGTIIASALGDAIGLYTEFLSAAQAAEAYPSRAFTLATHHNDNDNGGATPFKLDLHRAVKDPGHWTDDTDHALLLLLGYLHTASTNHDTANPLPTAVDFAARLRIWVQQGLRTLETMPLGLGRLVGTVVATKGFAEDPAKVARDAWRSTGRRVAPNGSLMRTHPLGLMAVFLGEPEAFALAAEVGRATHADPRCVVACVVGTGLVRGLVRGEVVGEGDVDGLVERAMGWFGDGKWEGGEEELWRHVRPEGEDGLGELKLDEAQAIGYVYKALGAGVVLLRMAMRRMEEGGGGLLVKGRLFEALITDLIMRGGDADTNACFAGALLGAYLGYGALPDHWKHGLLHGEWLIGKAEALCKVLEVLDGEYDGKQDADTLPDGGKGLIGQQEMEAKWMVLQQTAFKKMDEAKKSEEAEKRGSGSRWSVSLPWRDRGKRGR